MMKSNGAGPISKGDLDDLLKRAFLDQDFESNPVNELMMESVAKHVLVKSTFPRIIRLYGIDFLFGLSVLLICLGGSNGPEEELLTPKKCTAVVYLHDGHAKIKNDAASLTGTNTINKEHLVSADKMSNVRKKLKKKTSASIAGSKFHDVHSTQAMPQTSTVNQVQAPEAPEVQIEKTADGTGAFEQPVRSARDLSGASARIKTKPFRETTVVKGRKKEKWARKSIRRLFHRDGTFMLRGHKYGKKKLR